MMSFSKAAAAVASAAKAGDGLKVSLTQMRNFWDDVSRIASGDLGQIRQ